MINQFVSHRATNRYFELKDGKLDNFYSNDVRFYWLSLLGDITQRMEDAEKANNLPAPFQRLQRDLKSFGDNLMAYELKLRDSNFNFYYPDTLIEGPVHNKITPITSNWDVFQYFYETTQSLDAQWGKITTQFLDLKDAIALNQSLNFKDVLTHNYAIECVGPNKTMPGIRKLRKDNQYDARSIFTFQHCPELVELINNDGLTFTYNVGLEINYFNFYDALEVVSNHYPLEQVIKSEVFDYPMIDYTMSSSPSLELANNFKLYAIALRLPNRIPSDVWLQTSSSKKIYHITPENLKDNPLEATIFTSLEAAQKAVLNLKEYTYTFVEFSANLTRSVSLESKNQDFHDDIEANIQKITLDSALHAPAMNTAINEATAPLGSTGSTKKRLKI